MTIWTQKEIADYQPIYSHKLSALYNRRGLNNLNDPESRAKFLHDDYLRLIMIDDEVFLGIIRFIGWVAGIKFLETCAVMQLNR